MPIFPIEGLMSNVARAIARQTRQGQRKLVPNNFRETLSLFFSSIKL